MRACGKACDHALDQALDLDVVTKKFDSFLCNDVRFHELHNIRETKANFDVACNGCSAKAIDDLVKDQVGVQRTTDIVHNWSASVRTR